MLFLRMVSVKVGRWIFRLIISSFFFPLLFSFPTLFLLYSLELSLAFSICFFCLLIFFPPLFLLFFSTPDNLIYKHPYPTSTMANRISGTSANRISWIDGHNMISMESLAPSLELEPEEEPEEPTFPTRAYTNSSTFTALPVPPLFPDTQKPMIPERSERRNTLLLEPSTPKPSPPRSIHGVKWGIAGKENTVMC